MWGYIQERITDSPCLLQWLQAKHWAWSTALAYRAGSMEHSSCFSITLPPHPPTWTLYSRTGLQGLWRSWLCKRCASCNFSSLGNSELAETAQAQALCTAEGHRPSVILLSDLEVQPRALSRSGTGRGIQAYKLILSLFLTRIGTHLGTWTRQSWLIIRGSTRYNTD